MSKWNLRLQDSKIPFLMFQETNSWHDSSSFVSHSFQEFGLPFLLATVWYLPTFWQLRRSLPQWWLRCATWRNDHTAFGESQRRGFKMMKGWIYNLSHQLDGVFCSPFFSFWTGNLWNWGLFRRNWMWHRMFKSWQTGVWIMFFMSAS